MNNYTKKQEYGKGTFYFDENGVFHRLDGPAIESAGNYCAWYLNGVRMVDEKEFIDTKITLLIKEVLDNP